MIYRTVVQNDPQKLDDEVNSLLKVEEEWELYGSVSMVAYRDSIDTPCESIMFCQVLTKFR